VPTGWRTAPPDFVGVGAQRCGTTWWYELVTAHPGVQPGRHKELHFFHRYWQQPLDEAGIASYTRWFPRPPGTITGEWSPGYFSHHWIPPLLGRAAPEARFLVLLRDPVERYRSGLALLAQTQRRGAASASSAFRLGCYGLQLENLLAHVPRERVLVLQFERCTVAPADELARTYRFLGLDDGFVPTDLDRPRNRLPGAKPALSADAREALTTAYTPDVRRLVELESGIDPGLWPNFDHLDERSPT
jgi:Sulfotransferase domain